ncbi:Ku protein [Streptomyces sediminimaris]|uniref:non-homologous end joining protein Ku n=1 Tax=Streptomyces sediminimaris TaxID=3383721 RepID=UPI003999AFA7
MARPVWSGVVTLGLVTVPVALFTATEDHTVHFHQLQRGTSDRIRNKRVNERTGREVDHRDIVKGYDLGGGDYVVVEPAELEEVAPGRSKVIEMAGFVDLPEIEPVYFDRTYYVAPRGKDNVKVYELLRSALERTDKVGVATFTMHGKQYLTALRAQSDVLVMHTMHWADEVRDPADVADLLPTRRTRTTGKELRTAQELVDALTIDWNPEDYRDTFEERVKELVDAKRRGEDVVSESGPPDTTNVLDLMSALEKSIEGAGAKGSRRGGGKSRAKTGKTAETAEIHELDSHRRKERKETNKQKKQEQGKKKAHGKAQGKAQGKEKADGDLSSLTKTELYRRAADAGVEGRSKMTRDQLLRALRKTSAA